MEAAPSQQRKELAGVQPQAFSLEAGKHYCLIPTSWWKHWIAYSGWDRIGEPPPTGISVPGAIDNAVLLQPGQDATAPAAAASSDDAPVLLLKEGLREGSDFAVITEGAWDLLHAWYGGGPRIARPTVTEGGVGGRPVETQLELSLLKLHIHLEAAGNEAAKRRAGDAPLVLHLSRGAPLSSLVRRACGAWGLDASTTKCRVWDYYNRQRFNLLESLEESLSDAKLNAGQDVLLELEKAGGGWTFAEETGGTAASTSAAASSSSSSSSGGGGTSGGVTVGTRVGGTWSGARGLGGGSGAREDTVVDTSAPQTNGVVGLSNLGNTCFMNSMLQGLSNVSALREFFVSGAFESDLNPSNPLGAEGRLAQAFASLLRLMWGNGASVVSPRNFKHVLGQFAPQFAGYGQQDSQEFCNYVLDKLHEDVNRILKKPYVENFEPKGHETDRYIFGEVRRRHRLRNDSRLAELFEGYFKSTVVCPACDRVSVTFDPFMSLAVPLSVSDARRLAATLVRRDGTLHQLRLSVPIHGTVRHLLQAAAEHVAATDGLGAPLDVARLACIEVYNAKVQAIYTPSSKVEKLQSGDFIFLVETDEPLEPPPAGGGGGDGVGAGAGGYLVVAVQRVKASMSGRFVGLPLLLATPKDVSGRDLYTLVAERLRRYQRAPETPPPPEDEGGDAVGTTGGGTGAAVGAAAGSPPASPALPSSPAAGAPPSSPGESTSGSGGGGVGLPRARQWKLYVSSMSVGSFGYESPGAEVKRDDTPCAFATPQRAGGGYGGGGGGGSSASSSSSPSSSGAPAAPTRECRHVVIEWQPAAFEGGGGKYDRAKVDADDEKAAATACGRLPLGESGSGGKGSGVALSACLELFSREETLDADNAWYCDKCKTHREARKKLQVWSLPHVLVVHLKRFSAQGMWRKKNDTPVDFPFEIDLAKYALCQPGDEDRDGGDGGGESGGESAAAAAAASSMYDLQAVSNHYGSTGGGHYTAFAKNSVSGLWHKFDDSHTAVVEAKDVVTPAAYVLIYVRRGEPSPPRAGRTASPEV